MISEGEGRTAGEEEGRTQFPPHVQFVEHDLSTMDCTLVSIAVRMLVRISDSDAGSSR